MEDFHIHTTFSDGSNTVFDIISLTKNFDMFSITDHNNINGCKKICENNFIPGVEFSCLTDKKEIHILGYNFDLNDKNINKLLDENNYYNNKIFLDIFNNIVKEFKLRLDNSDVLKLIKQGISLNKVNISNILLNNNIGNNIYDTYNNYVKKFLVNEYYYLDLKQVIEAVKQSNGYVILAHPYAYNLSNSDVDLLVKKLIYLGIDGIEITPFDFNKTFDIIKKYDLIYSMGSDFHGKEFHKCNVIGMNYYYVDKDERYIKNLLLSK